MTGPWHNPERQSVGFEAITVSTSAVVLTVQGAAVAAEIQVENGPIRYRTDGAAPTASVGHLLSAGDVLYLDNPSELHKLSMIRDDTTDGDITVSYFNQ